MEHTLTASLADRTTKLLIHVNNLVAEMWLRQNLSVHLDNS